MDPRDRREHPRFEGQFNVDLLNMGHDPHFKSFEPVVPSVALDVSKKGVRLQSPYNAAVRSMISVIVYFKNRESICLCEVMWKREMEENKFLYGLFIKDWSQLDQKLELELSKIESKKNSPLSEGTTPASNLIAFA